MRWRDRVKGGQVGEAFPYVVFAVGVALMLTVLWLVGVR